MMSLLLLDNYDSFTYNVYQLMCELGAEVEVIRHDKITVDDRFCDEIWYIFVSEEIRRKRLADSRGYSQEKITAILKRQMTETEFQKRSDVVIRNDGTPEELESRILSKIKAQ